MTHAGNLPINIYIKNLDFYLIFRRGSLLTNLMDDCSFKPVKSTGKGTSQTFTSLKDLLESIEDGEKDRKIKSELWWKPLLVSNKYSFSEEKQKTMDFTWSANLNKSLKTKNKK